MPKRYFKKFSALVLNTIIETPFWITRHGSACMNSIGESRRKGKESDSKDEKKDRSINCGNNHRSYINLDKSYF
jgi:hypothetical protein